MRYLQRSSGLLVPDSRVRRPEYRSPRRQRGFLRTGMAFWGGPSGAGGGGDGDPYWSDVFSLCPMSGTNGSTSFPDIIAGRTWTPTSASITTSQSPFAGGSSGNFGTSGSLTTGTLADWKFLHDGTQAYTIDIWAYINALGSSRMFFGTNGASSANTGLAAWVDPTGHLRFFMTKAGSTIVNWTSGAILVSADTWYLVSFEWNPSGAGMMWSYLNGTLETTGGVGGTGAYSTSNPTYALQLGASGNAGGLPLDGYASNWRVTKALRYGGASFTPPISPFPTA